MFKEESKIERTMCVWVARARREGVLSIAFFKNNQRTSGLGV